MSMTKTEQAVFEQTLKALRWIHDIVCTSDDGGDAWCAVRNRPGAQKWFAGMKEAVPLATALLRKTKKKPGKRG